ncbi:DoxX family protein [Jiulongibacter sediminis]|uniref:Membrane protein n=1 Tax=Jiulongibacter sediminis TaxID=1605367 RepID=A0A0N8H9M4_9BACT|nr:DoxX family protein [Jiulongibacter sediminis]KPM47780.1 membrane protein [Jiulongibacter sediminis]TBX23964.1 membrane protein [Jiulongibacter sediminis]
MENISKTRLWISRIMSGFVVLFLTFDIVMKFMKPEEVITTTVNELGYQEHHIATMGILLLISTILYVIPKTSILGAVLLTGYLGGAIATHLRVDNPLFSHLLFPVYFGILLWGGLWLRNEKLRSIFPLIS